MYAARDKSGIVLLSKEKPLRMDCHWKAPTCEYMVMNANFGNSVFPELQWMDEPIYIECLINKFNL